MHWLWAQVYHDWFGKNVHKGSRFNNNKCVAFVSKANVMSSCHAVMCTILNVLENGFKKVIAALITIETT